MLGGIFCEPHASMSTERRYNEQEIAEIFEQAARAQESAQKRLSSREGLTLAELQEIGAEAGITPDFIAHAAAGMDHRPVKLPRTSYLGLPVGVGRTTKLPGPLSDENWERLVTDLRNTFDARGKIWRDGSLRQWTNGNLQALIEPTDSGHRLRLSTKSDWMRAYLNAGLGSLSAGLFFLTFFMVDTVKEPPLYLIASLLLTMGVGFLIYCAIKGPRWALEREKQMDAIAARATELASGNKPIRLPEPNRAARLDLDALPDPEASTSMPSSQRTRS